VPNPLSLGQVVDAVSALAAGGSLHHAVSLTGGEPLVHAEFVAALGSVLRRAGMTVCLETNGTLPDALADVVGCIDHVAMDVKLESATGQPTPWDTHGRFLACAASRDVEVKAVVARDTTEDELTRLAELVASVDAATPVVLQPVTPEGGVRPASPEQVLQWQDALLRRLPHVRVIPQVHKLMGQK
jgi:organic radical activating enzyme